MCIIYDVFTKSPLNWLLLVVFVINCAGQEDSIVYTSEDYWKNETPLQCYDCNSAYDPRCGDPFNPYSIGIVNCSEQKPPEHLINPDMPSNQRLKPTVCRKLVQKVEGKKRVIRECGYIQDDRDDKACPRRTGTKDVEVFYCSCTTPLCNKSAIVRPGIILIGAFALGLLGLKV